MNVVGALDARFIQGTRDSLFSVHHAAASGALDECFVIAPAFAEEMNRCRYMCTMFAQSASSQGFGTLNVDPLGTGDSAGEFVDADWAQWGDDLCAAVAHARSLGYAHVSLLGIRLGALLAMSVIERLGELRRVILWQPVTSGKSTLTQFLRIRIAASLERDEEGGNVADFRRQLEAGEPLQVAGYDVSPDLFRGIEAASLENHLAYSAAPVSWFTTLASEGRKTPRAELSLLEKWRDAGATVDHHTVIGPSYWAVHERTLAPSLVEATVEHVAARGAHA